MTMFIRSLCIRPPLHVPFAPERLQTTTVFLILCTAGTFGDIDEFSTAKFFDDLLRVLRGRLNRSRARIIPQGTIPLAVPLIIIQRDGRDLLTIDVFPDVQFRPVEQRVDADMRSGNEIRLVLIPKFRWLFTNVPFVPLVPWRE